MDPEVRRMALIGESKLMEKIRCPAIDWRPADHRQPPESYIVTFNIPSYTRLNEQGKPVVGYQHRISIHLSSEFPSSLTRDDVRAETPVWNPHVFSSGHICFRWREGEESLAHLCLNLARYLLWDPDVINPDDPANVQARDFFLTNRSKGKFPLARVHLPLPMIDRSQRQFSERSTKPAFTGRRV